MATVIGSSPGAEQGMPWLLEAAVLPASRQCTTPGCVAALHMCCPEAVMAFGIIGEGCLVYNQVSTASCPGSLLLGTQHPGWWQGRAGQGYASPRPAAHAGNLQPTRAWKPLCTAPGALAGARNETNYKRMLRIAVTTYLLLSHHFTPQPFSQLCVCSVLYEASRFSWFFYFGAW